MRRLPGVLCFTILWLQGVCCLASVKHEHVFESPIMIWCFSDTWFAYIPCKKYMWKLFAIILCASWSLLHFPIVSQLNCLRDKAIKWWYLNYMDELISSLNGGWDGESWTLNLLLWHHVKQMSLFHLNNLYAISIKLHEAKNRFWCGEMPNLASILAH